MPDPAARLLVLLSLLQTPREWPSSELAQRLGVTDRTVRRDVDRLRGLGYPVEASMGAYGGYRLAAGAAACWAWGILSIRGRARGLAPNDAEGPSRHEL